MGCIQKKEVIKTAQTVREVQTEEEDPNYQTFFKTEDAFYSEYEFIQAICDDDDILEMKVHLKEYDCTRIAIRVMKHPVKTEDMKLQQNLRMLLRVKNPFLQRNYAVYEFPQKYFLVREFVQGISIIDLLKKQNFKEGFIAKQTQYVLQALNYLHKREIFHGKLSTQSLVYDPQKSAHPILISYGLNFPGFTQQTFANPLSPECFYRPPEFLRGEISKKSDVWAVGVLIYFLNTGTMPFDGKDATELRKCIQRGVPNFDIQELYNISCDGVLLIKKLLKYGPSFRPTIQQCLAHTWFLKQAPKINEKDKKNLLTHVDNIQKFHFTNRLQQAAMLILVEKNITQKNEEKLRKQFMKLDMDKSGALSRDEILKGLLLIMDEKQAKIQLEDIFQKGDLDGHGEIDFYEFLMVFGHKQKYATEQKVAALFRQTDKDSSGMLDMKEVRQLLVSLDVSESEFNQIMKQFDKNGDGQISEKEFIDGMMGIMNVNQNDYHNPTKNDQHNISKYESETFAQIDPPLFSDRTEKSNTLKKQIISPKSKKNGENQQFKDI